MKNAIIIHGKPSKDNYYDVAYPTSSNFAWIPWLQKELVARDIKADTPEMPYSYRPDYGIWKREFERFDITSETILVGHSAAGGFLLRWLSENKNTYVDKVVLVAPSMDPLHKSETGFCDFIIDPLLHGRIKQIILMTSDNDSEAALLSVQMIIEAIPDIDVRMFTGYGHFIPEHLGKSTLEEVRDIILEL